MYKTAIEIKIRYAHSDQMEVVYYSNYYTYYKIAQTNTLLHIKLSNKQMEKKDIIIPKKQLKNNFFKSNLYKNLIITAIKKIPKIKIYLKPLLSDIKFSNFAKILQIIASLKGRQGVGGCYISFTKMSCLTALLKKIKIDNLTIIKHYNYLINLLFFYSDNRNLKYKIFNADQQLINIGNTILAFIHKQTYSSIHLFFLRY